jgi:thiopeptide-type bacteriocin biosynthesis protein
MALAYDMHSFPLVFARVPAFPIALALDVLSDGDPFAATAEVYRANDAARAALFDASPSLAQAVDEWLEGKPLRNEKTPLRALSYLLRMCARPTPFGLCAGIGRVSVGEGTSLAIEDEARWRTYTRPDMQMLLQLAASLEQSEKRSGIRYVANECVVERGGRLFVTNVAMANQEVSGGAISAKQRAVTLKNTDAVSAVRGFCEVPRSLGDIAERLAGQFAAPLPDALQLTQQLIEAGLLISELVPSPVGNPSAFLLERFQELDAAFYAGVRDATGAAAALDLLPVTQRTAGDYRAVHAAFNAVLPDATNTPIQTDLSIAFSGTLGKAVLRDVELFTEYSARMGCRTTLQRLHDTFLERYEGVERMVPLLELADENLGISIPETPTRIERDVAARNALLFRLACEAARTGAEEVAIDDAMMDVIAPPLAPDESLLPSTEVGFSIAATDAEAVDAGDYFIVPAGYRFSDTANKSLGRFAHTFDAETLARMRTIAREGETPGSISAEFAFALRDERAYNVATRPSLYDRELRVGIGQPPAKAALSPNDLWVGIDRGRFFLWSHALQSRVDIRETHAFATAFRAPDLCRLLALLRYDGARTLDEFDWGDAAGCTYLPRVRIGRIVLALRQWNFDVRGFDLRIERERWNIPRYVYLAEEDRRMLVDLDSPVADALVADLAGSRKRLVLFEALPLPDREWVRGTRGAHVSEFIAEAVRAYKPVPAPMDAPVLFSARTVHGPGSEWTFAKLYCGRQTTGHVLQTRIAPLIAGLRSEGAIDRWFFVRYGDPQDHIRLRFRATEGSATLVRERVACETESWLQDGTLSRVAFETYSPEYERYGGADAIAASEAFFTYDSDAVLELLRAGSRSTDGLVALAASSFDGYLAGERLTALALRALAPLSKQKAPAGDRDALKRAAAILVPEEAAASFEAALDAGAAGQDAKEKRLCDLIHMHCNRLGVTYESESRVYALLRAMALRRSALKKEREPELSGSRS